MKWFLWISMSSVIGTGIVLTQTEAWPRRENLSIPSRRTTADNTSGAVPSPRMIFAAGIVEGKHREVALQFELQGRLSAIDVREGDRVERGDDLARLDAAVWGHKLARARANLAAMQARRERLVNGASDQARDAAIARTEVAKVKVKRALQELRRGEELYSKNAISRKDWEDYNLDYKTAFAELVLQRARAAQVNAPARQDELRLAESEIAEAKENVREAQTMLNKTALRAPFGWPSA